MSSVCFFVCYENTDFRNFRILQLFFGVSCHSGSECQLAGKPIAFISIVGNSSNSAFSFCVNVLLGDTVKSKYFIMQIRKYTRFISVVAGFIHEYTGLFSA